MTSRSNSTDSAGYSNPVSTPTLGEATRVWLKIGLLSFGGPAAQMALMHRFLVEEKRWLDEQTYLNALSFCMLLPGPEAMQLATYGGWRLHGTIGGLIAGLLFVLPGAIVVLILAATYMLLGDIPLVTTIFLGIKAAVLVIVLEALLKISKRALGKPIYWLLAAFSFIGIFFLSLPFPLIVLGAGLFGFFFGQRETQSQTDIDSVDQSWAKLWRTVLVWLVIWAIPLVLVNTLLPQPFLAEVGIFFSKLAVVTFGGAYAVLAYMGQAVVDQFGWLTAGEMMDGLGLAETTPGPLILVNEFVGFIAGFREAGLGLGVAAAVMSLWVTFVPCFLWIFAGAPYINWIGNQPRLRDALRAITAAVVGVILNLSIWFALHVLFREVNLEKWGAVTLWKPAITTFEPLVFALAAISAVLLLLRHWSIISVLLVSAAGAILGQSFLV
ncbi:MAG: chromate efflux transporter [Acidiferrobacterales bacterium]|nr:chromate efflux transporter [Acidiferrobacterales bacterium]